MHQRNLLLIILNVVGIQNCLIITRFINSLRTIMLIKTLFIKNRTLKQSASQTSLNGFSEKSKPKRFFSFPSFSKVSNLSLFLVALFFFVGTFKTAHAAWWSSSKDLEEETKPSFALEDNKIPGTPPKEFLQQFVDHLETVDQEKEKNPTIPHAIAALKKKIAGDLKNVDNSLAKTSAIFSKIDREVQEALYGFRDTDVFRGFCSGSEDIYHPSKVNIFETTSFLSSITSEPLFLENKEEFSVELRPFYRGCETDAAPEDFSRIRNQIGIAIGLRKQYESHFFSTHVLYGFSGLRSEIEAFESSNSSEDQTVILGLTGGLFKNWIGGKLTVVMGANFSELNNDNRSLRKGEPRTLFGGLSPLIVFYPKSFPIDFFVGGDALYLHRLRFKEQQTYRNLHHACFHDYMVDIFWRVKGGPSYTLKKSSKKRLYQLAFSVATNLQSALPDHLTFSPKILFESQAHEKRGGWLLDLEGTFSKRKTNLSIAYGLRF